MPESVNEWRLQTGFLKLFELANLYQDLIIMPSVRTGQFYVGSRNRGIFFEGTPEQIAREMACLDHTEMEMLGKQPVRS